MASLPVTQVKTLPDAWDYKGRPAERSKSGGWASAAMILGVEACERLTTLGIAVNLVTYLTGTMHLGNATSANTVTNFLGTSFMLCLLGGFIADTFLGRYLTIGIFATVQATKRKMELPSDPSLLFNVDDIAEGLKKMKQKLPHSKQFR
ncbi:Proton-dependent oligopeptide transporter family [Corchorus capsularis]|uniref:Proton-dependent oligopeptide transporter family n=1 Tax=Corchorus capsularis TaxID=210143 RepID=A0A1R3GAN6_COCAP|nr:Proton-dependent oligopeptide transporter family [Corchorus capsularis]